MSPPIELCTNIIKKFKTMQIQHQLLQSGKFKEFQAEWIIDQKVTIDLTKHA